VGAEKLQSLITQLDLTDAQTLALLTSCLRLSKPTGSRFRHGYTIVRPLHSRLGVWACRLGETNRCCADQNDSRQLSQISAKSSSILF
jgi:hypothetical protein